MEKSRNWRRLIGFGYSCFILVSLIFMFVMTGKDLGETSPKSNIYADFVGYYRSGKMVLSEDRSKIYVREMQLKYFNELGAAQESAQFIYSQNPPFFFVMLAPFALLPINFSFKLWIALSIVCPLISIFLLMKGLHKTSFQTAVIFVLAALLSVPGWICVFVGQMSWFIAFLVSLFCLGFLSKKDALTGIALALTTSKFQYVFLLGVPLLAMKRWHAIAWAAGAELALLAASALVIGPQNVLAYPSTLFNAETTKDYIGVFPEHMISLRGVLSLFLGRHEALVASSIVMFVGLIPLFLLWHKESKIDTRSSSAWALAITICAALLLSAHTHIYDDVLLLVVAALTLPLLLASLGAQASSRHRAKDGSPEDTDTSSLESAKAPGSESVPTGKRRSQAAALIWQTILYAFPVGSWIIFIACNNFESIRRTPFAFLNLILLAAGIALYMQCIQTEQKHVAVTESVP